MMNDLALKRELMRVGSLMALAEAASGGAASASELHQVRMVLCRANSGANWRNLLGSMSLPETSARSWLERLARARRATRQLTQPRFSQVPPGSQAPWEMVSRPKHPGDARFQLPMSEALKVVETLQELIGVTRVGMIGELSDLGIQVSQAARPSGRWSNSYGSGKSETPEGAIVGAVMEETEKWAQEQFNPPRDQLLRASYAELKGNSHSVDPRALGLPFDSGYSEDQPLDWYACYDLLRQESILVPVDVLSPFNAQRDILYSPRGARKVFSTNGLASGFSREEATLHALCEVVERHARKLSHNRLSNPGGLGVSDYRLVELAACSAATRALADKLQPSGRALRVLDITSEIAVPTYHAVVEDVDSGVRASGWGTHPNPEVALRMAMLEAGQSAVVAIAGGREDLLIQARSLGRHEGARPRRAESWWYFADPDRATTTPAERRGLLSDDICADILWVLDEVRSAGVDCAPAVDCSRPGMGPACTVRVILPGVESTNPYHTGLRGRAAMLPDLLPPLAVSSPSR
jgi:ribosomal protein S12 methylthiotransferase accessory factor